MRFGSSLSRESSPMLFRRSLSMRTLWPHSTRATSKLQSESVNNTSTMLSVPPDRSLAPHTLEVLKLVDRIARELELDYFVTGALARDILLSGVFGLDSGRGTMDVDLAIAVEDWSQFNLVKRRLLATHAFTAEDSTPHRLFHREDVRQRAYPLDLLPFGGIEERPHRIVWPPDLSIVMNVAG